MVLSEEIDAFMRKLCLESVTHDISLETVRSWSESEPQSIPL